ncbi:CAP domain-containing protein [Demequina globuliformis]|uniref:CAP domain-containing protein n=1 Tax=Demequina globuliformis TaxID=676202 RepID=UPI0007804F9E|nr:CAP domain-containing protein [Demequina globuliformis]
MTPPPDAPSPRRQRHSRLAVAALVAIPVAVASTTGAAAGLWAPDPVAAGAPTVSEAPSRASVDDAQVTTAAVSGGDASWDLSGMMPRISVSLPPNPSPSPAPTAPTGAAGDGSAGGVPPEAAEGDASAGPGSAPDAEVLPEAAKPAPSARSRDEYCASPDGAAGASSAQSMLSAANVERARIGAAPLSWSTTLASAAMAWSSSMAAQDSATAATMDALAHNPSRPAGGENVAVSYSSAGQSQGAAAASAHSGWVFSFGHCMNMLNPQYAVMGAGMAVTDDGTTWYSTANFQ